MQTVYLNGGISQFGTKWSTNCTNIRDIFKLIDCQTPGFRQYLVNAAENDVDFEIKREYRQNDQLNLRPLDNQQWFCMFLYCSE